MKLLFLSNYYPPHHLGGYEELCADVANGLQSRGHAVSVLTSNHGVNGAGKATDGIYRLLHPEVDPHPFGPTLNFFLGRSSRLRANLASLERTVKEFQPDILMVWAMWNLSRQLLVLAESWGRPPVVYYIADYWPTLPDAYTLHWQEPARRWYTFQLKKVFGQVALRMLSAKKKTPNLCFDHALCVSNAVRERLMQWLPQFAQARVVYNGVAANSFGSRLKGGVLNIPQSSLSILYAGRLSREKGVHTAIEAIGLAVKQGCDVRLTVLGQGSPEYRARLENLVRQTQVADRVVFQSRVPREQMPQMLERFDVLVVPSVWAEPLPRIAQEAMAAGLVVLATPVGGMPEIVVDGVNGLMFPPEDAKALAAQIERLLSDSSLRVTLVKQGRQTVEQKFDITRTIDEIEAYLEKVIVTSG